ncbi:MAG: aldo/keto reductase, partial [Cryobacterium sp.]|nr:aldo/keto reductase [Cryobacterium sp.]
AHDRLGVVTQSWSPLGQGGELLADPVITGLADELGVTPAQVVIRWHLQTGNIVFPKSNRRERMIENFDVFDFELSRTEVATISALERAGRVSAHPADVN